MDDLEQRIRDLRQEAQQAGERRAVAEKALEEALTRIRDGAQRLREEFGVTSLEEAHALEARLAEQVSAEAKRAREALERAEGKPCQEPSGT